MIRSIAAELLKLRKRPAVLTTFAVWLVLGLVFGYVFPYFSYTSLDESATSDERALALEGLLQALPGSLGPASIQGLPIFAGALAIVIGVLTAGSEYVWRTQKMILTQGPDRDSIIVGKIVALGAILFGVLVCDFTVNAVASVLVARATDRTVDWPGIVDIGTALGAGLLIAGVWSMFGVLIATLLRGTAVPIGLGVVWALAVEVLLRAGSAEMPVVGTLQQYTPGSAAGSLVASVGAATQSAGGTPGIAATISGPLATGVLFVYLLVFLTATLLVNHTRDVE